MENQPEESINSVLQIISGLQPYATLPWGDIGARKVGEVIEADWLDIFVPEICNPLGLNWLWTIESSSNVRDQNEFNLTIPHDKVIYAVSKSNALYDCDTVIIKEIGVSLSKEEEKSLRKLAAQRGERIISRTCWSSKQLHSYMKKWCKDHAGRPDLTFEYDTELVSPLYTQNNKLNNHESNALASAENEFDQNELYMISEGIKITSTAFDALLEMDPERAAEVVKAMQELLINRTDHNDIEIDLLGNPFDEREE
ncbi:MAG: hypothetical protein ACKOW9_00340 [Candidatus Paceibacterota bacterium]